MGALKRLLLPVTKSVPGEYEDDRLKQLFGEVDNRMDIVMGRLWDSISYTAGATVDEHNSRLFADIGPQSRKTYADTNMMRAQQLCAPEAFAVERITFTFSKDSLDADVYALAESLAWDLWLGKKTYATALMISMHAYDRAQAAPFRVCEYCRAVYVQERACPGCGAREFTLSGFGEAINAGRQFVMDIDKPLVILNQMQFWVGFRYFHPHTLRGALKLWCHFEGPHARGVC